MTSLHTPKWSSKMSGLVTLLTILGGVGLAGTVTGASLTFATARMEIPEAGRLSLAAIFGIGMWIGVTVEIGYPVLTAIGLYLGIAVVGDRFARWAGYEPPEKELPDWLTDPPETSG